MGRIRFLILLAVLIPLSGCGGRQDLVVARVGDKKITIRDFNQAVARLPKEYRMTKKGLDGQKEYLKTMIGKELLALEARNRGLDKDEEVAKKLEDEKQKLIHQELYNRRVIAKAKVTDKEARKYFTDNKLNEGIRLSHILVKTKPEAEAMLGELEKGRSFEALAKEKSLDKRSAKQGGDLGWYVRGGLIPLLEEKAFSLEVGQISEPIRTSTGYQILKLTGKREVKFEELKGMIKRRLRGRKQQEMRIKDRQKLYQENRLECDTEALKVLLGKEKDPETRLPILSEEEKRIVLLRYDGGKMTLGQCVEFLRKSHCRGCVVRALSDSASLRDFAEGELLSRVFVPKAARKAGLHKDKKILSQLEQTKEKLMVERLRGIEVLDKAEITEEEARRYFNTHRGDYIMPARAEVREILVKTEQEAQALLRKIKRGADMLQLAQKHTIRPKRSKTLGEFPVRNDEICEKIHGREFVKALFQAKVGELVGPVKVKGGYSIFRVLNREEERRQSFEEVQGPVSSTLRQEKQEKMFEQLLQRLRRKYASEVVEYEDVLKLTLL